MSVCRYIYEEPIQRQRRETGCTGSTVVVSLGNVVPLSWCNAFWVLWFVRPYVTRGMCSLRRERHFYKLLLLPLMLRFELQDYRCLLGKWLSHLLEVDGECNLGFLFCFLSHAPSLSHKERGDWRTQNVFPWMFHFCFFFHSEKYHTKPWSPDKPPPLPWKPNPEAWLDDVGGKELVTFRGQTWTKL